jgi:D-sedoheptulose 7-phosphate isomerase
MKEEAFLDQCIAGHPALAVCRQDIDRAFRLLAESFDAGGTLLVCGNGGSAADAAHIVGELMKGFLLARPLPESMRARLAEADPEIGPALGARLQGALPVINLADGMSLATAFANDVSAEMAYAQAASGYGRRGGALLGLSTSGNARNVLAALCVARALGLKTIGMTGREGGRMKGRCDVLIRVPADRTPEIQELHLPVYHCLCAMLEARFFS